MKNIAVQTELFFVAPGVLNAEKQVFMGHFTSKVKIKNRSKSTIIIDNDGNEITGIKICDELREQESDSYFTDPEIPFLHAPSLNHLMSYEQLRVHTLLNQKTIYSEISIIEIPALNEDNYSYLFFGFASEKVGYVQHSKVFYTDECGNICFGGEATHKTGNSISFDFCSNYSFGFGKKMALRSVTSKEYLDGIEEYYKILFLEDKTEKMKKNLAKVFHNMDEDYFSYLKHLNDLKKERNVDKIEFWQTEEYAKFANNLSSAAILRLKNI